MQKLADRTITKLIKKIIPVIAILIVACIFYFYNSSVDEMKMLGNKQAKAIETTVPDGYIGIYNEEDLKAVNSNLSGKYILMADIDMTGKEHQIIGTSQSSTFKGTFDGNGHKISNINIESSNTYVGMFGYVGGATIKNLTIENININATISGNVYAGGLAGYASGNQYVRDLVIEDINIIGNNLIKDSENAKLVALGGLIGYGGYFKTLTNCTVEAEIVENAKGSTSDIKVGGLTGHLTSEISNCSTNVKIRERGDSATGVYVGGLIGFTNSSKVENCYSDSQIIVEQQAATVGTTTTIVGGLIGRTKYDLSNCYANTNIEINSNLYVSAGGLIGSINDLYRRIKVSEVYSTGDIIINNVRERENSSRVGGLIGYTSPDYDTTTAIVDIQNTFSTVNLKNNTNGEYLSMNGLVGGYYQRQKISNSYFVGKIDTSNLSTGIEGTTVTNSYWCPELVNNPNLNSSTEYKMLQELFDKDMFVNWDFDTIWQIDENGGSLPYLKNLEKPDSVEKQNIEYINYLGDGTENNPYIIDTPEKFQNMAFTQSQLYYELANDINLDSIENFIAIGCSITKPFKSVLDGKDYKISTQSCQSGIFNCISNATIKNLNVENYQNSYKSISDRRYIGGLVNEIRSDSNIQNVNVNVDIQLDTSDDNASMIGGLAGLISNSVIENVNVSGNIKYENENNTSIYVGGIAGEIFGGTLNNLEVTDSHLIVNTQGKQFIGGIGGSNTGSITSTSAEVSIQSNSSGITKIGGLIGELSSSSNKIYNCYSKGNIQFEETSGSYIGGLIGESKGNVEKVYSTVNITGRSSNTTYIGGLIGRSELANITNAYEIGKIDVETTSLRVGGLLGSYKNTHLENTYAVGRISTQATYAGGLIGRNEDEDTLPKSTTIASYWAVDSTGQGTSIDGTDRFLEDMIYQDNYPTWDFENVWAIEPDGASLPYFKDGEPAEIDDVLGVKTINKVDEEGKILSNVKFEITNESGEIVRKGWTNKSGKYYIIGLPEGVYQLKETEAQSYYKLPEPWTFRIMSDGTAIDISTGLEMNFNIINEKIKVDVEIKKYKEGTEEPVKGAVIGLYSSLNIPIKDKDGNHIKIETDENGIAIFEKLQVGNYKYREVEAPEGYKLNNTFYGFSVTKDEEVKYLNDTNIIYNTPKFIELDPGTDLTGEKYVLIRKYTNTNEAVPGAVIGLFDENGNILKNEYGKQIKLTTNKDGKVVFKIVPGTYKYKELEAPEGCIIDSTMYEFTVAEDGTVTFTSGTNGIIYNRLRYNPIPGNIKDEDIDPEIYGKYVTIRKYESGTDIALSGAKIALYNENGEELKYVDGSPIIMTTNKDGKIRISLEPGNYKYKEIQAPTGYRLDNTIYEFTVREDGTAIFANGTNGIIYNIPKNNPIPGDMVDEDIDPGIYGKYVTIRKYEVGTDTPLSGAEIALYNENGEQLRDVSGNPIRMTTNEYGKIRISLEPGTYKYRELKAPNGYILNRTIYEFTVREDGTVEFANGTDGIIYNRLKYNQIPGDMADEDIDPGIYGKYVTIRKYKAGTDIPLSGAKIALYNENGEQLKDVNGNPIIMTTNEYGKIRISLEPGTYKYREIQAPAGYRLDNTIYEFTVREDGTAVFANGTNGIIYNIPKNNPIPGDIEDPDPGVYGKYVTIRKYKSGTETPLSGAIIALYNEDGEQLKDVNGNPIIMTTNEYGEIRISLEPGTYKYREIQAPAGYRLDNTIYEFTVREDGTAIFANGTNGIIYNIPKNNPIPGDMADEDIDPGIYGKYVTIKKYKSGTETPLSGAVIAIYNQNGEQLRNVDGNPIEMTTNRYGQVRISLEPGTYKYKEIQAPSGYILDSTMYEFTVNEDGIVIFANGTNGIIYNEKEGEGGGEEEEKGKVTIRKYIEGTTNSLQGAVIEIYQSGERLATLTTNEEGKIEFKVDPGTYQYREVKAPDGYILDSTIYEFTVAEDGTVTFSNNTYGIIYNKKMPEKKHQLVIKKYETGTTTALKGAIIALYDKEGNQLKDERGNAIIIETNEIGEATIELEKGEYKYKEIQAPNGYVLNDTIYEFTVSEDGTVTFANETNGIIYNEKIKEEEKGKVIIRKYIEGTVNQLQGAVIEIYQSGERLATLTTNEEGKIEFKVDPGTYQYKEVKAPDGYILDSTMYEFTVTEDGIITFANNTYGIIYNKKILEKYPLIIRKYETGTTIALKGAIIALYDKEGNQLKDEAGNAITIETNERGEALIELEAGEYQYREIKAPDGYELNYTIYRVIVNEDGTIEFVDNTEGTIYDDKIHSENPDIPGDPEEPDTPGDSGDNSNSSKNNIINNNIFDNSIKSGTMPNTGIQYSIIIVIVVIISIGIYFMIKLKYVEER